MNDYKELLSLSVFYLEIMRGRLEELTDDALIVDPDTGNSITMQAINAFILEYNDA